jgi:hypothetical protein
MSITVIVENDTIKLPSHVHVPDGTRLEITLPGADAEAATVVTEPPIPRSRGGRQPDFLARQRQRFGGRVLADSQAVLDELRSERL